jgi:hypothetical protein
VLALARLSDGSSTPPREFVVPRSTIITKNRKTKGSAKKIYPKPWLNPHYGEHDYALGGIRDGGTH